MTQGTCITAWHEKLKSINADERAVLTEIRKEPGTINEIAKRMGWEAGAGQPHLADVLLAMNKLQHDGSYVISDAGIFVHFKAEGARIDKALRVLECSWKLRKDDLNEQSEETINFLAELLRQ